MSTADSWDVTVPDDAHAGELLSELRRHGVVTGQRLRVLAVVGEEDTSRDEAPAPLTRSRQRRRLRFAGLGAGPDGISSNTDHHLAEGLGEA